MKPDGPSSRGEGVGLRKIFDALFFKKSHKTSAQFVRYLCVGAVAYCADFGTLAALTELGGINYLISAAIGFILGLAVNYVLSILWVFPKRSVIDKKMEFLVFALVGLAGLGINELIIWLFTEHGNVHYLLSKIISTAVVFLWNFIARKKLLFS